MSLHRTRMLIALLCLAAIALAATGTLAHAAGTGDDPTPTADVLTKQEAAAKARLENEKVRPADKNGGGAVGPSAMIIDAPYGYTYTPSHKQETTYWCGPATCQVIDHFFGSYVSQSTYAKFMGTTTGGTDFSLVDDCLRHYTGKPYYYYGGLTESGFTSRVSNSIKNHGMPLAADLRIIASIWPNYNFNHAGHIVPIEAFDWRTGTIRLNDVFNEADIYSGGGATFGHRTYDYSVVWNGVYNHFRRAVVSAP